MQETNRPVLIYDGDCAFCAWQVRYWRRLTGDAVDYQPYQAAAERYPDVPPGEFARAIQLMTADGRRYSGAEAAFRVLAAGGRTASLACYRYLPGCSRFSEAVYRFVSRHRAGAYRLARLSWGRERYPAQYHLVSWLFLRGLALIYLFAFASLGLHRQDAVTADQSIGLQAEGREGDQVDQRQAAQEQPADQMVLRGITLQPPGEARQPVRTGPVARHETVHRLAESGTPRQITIASQ